MVVKVTKALHSDDKTNKGVLWNRKEKTVIGCNSSNELAVSSSMKWVNFPSFKSTVTAENIADYVCKCMSLTSSSISCYMWVKKGVYTDSLKRVNFKL